jgi:hypothetical protein
MLNFGTLVLFALLTLTSAPAIADPVEDFYGGKRVTLVIGYGTGGRL